MGSLWKVDILPSLNNHIIPLDKLEVCSFFLTLLKIYFIQKVEQQREEEREEEGGGGVEARAR